jgi:Na+/H+ antiporter NhaC
MLAAPGTIEEYERRSLEPDGGTYAVAVALLVLAKALSAGENAGQMGAIGFLALRLGEQLGEGFHRLATAVEEFGA